MIVFGASASPFVRKVLVFAAEKGVALENRPHMGPNGPDPDFLKASPFRKMPAFQDGDFLLSDSTAIVAYLEKTHPEPALIPSEPKAHARAIWFEEYADTILAVPSGKMFFNRLIAPVLGLPADLAAADRAEREELPTVLAYLEGVLPQSGWLVEDRVTLADIAVASHFMNFSHMNMTIDAARFPKVSAFAEKMAARPSFAKYAEEERKAFGLQ